MDTVAWQVSLISGVRGDWFFQLQILQEVISHSISPLIFHMCVCSLHTP